MSTARQDREFGAHGAARKGFVHRPQFFPWLGRLSVSTTVRRNGALNSVSALIVEGDMTWKPLMQTSTVSCG